MRRVLKNLILFSVGGFLYILVELLWRGYSHWTMFLLGGLCFFYAGIQNEHTAWEKPLLLQSVQVALFITAAEFITGCIVNLWLGWNVWDYSDMPFNLLGQICPQYILLWVVLGAVAVVADDYARYWFFHEEKPRYRLV